MKKQGVLNNRISQVIAQMGHMDELVIADAGLPIPDSTERIDLALKEGVPGFIETLKALLADLEVEGIVLAEETKEKSSELFHQIQGVVENTPIIFLSHDTFKTRTQNAKAVIRTGEFTPFANIILISGVVF